VVQDCLHICNNILSDSETCQRLFYAMGTDWILRLADFFDPALLESIDRPLATGLEGDSSDEEGRASSRGAGACWFDEPARLACAVLALTALYHSLSTPNKKHQTLLASATSVVVPSAAFWLARRGPSELVNAGMSLLCRLVEGGNAEVGNLLSNAYITVPPAVQRKNFPSDVEPPSLTFGWKPLPGDERKFISLLSLLAERYIFPADAWDPASGPVLPTAPALKLAFNLHPRAQSGPGVDLASSALAVLERILAVDTSISDLIVQYILAPPPPPHVDGMFADEYEQAGRSARGGQLEVMKPLGSHVLHLLVEGCNRVLEGSAGSTTAGRGSLEVAERAANVLAVVCIHGSQLGRELCTAISTAHAGAQASAAAAGPKMILPMLLFAAGRTARSAGVAGYPLLVSILRLLACIASDCERAAKQMLDDPANLFVVDLATAASESAGVPAQVQTAACMFLGCCFEALPVSNASPPPSTNGVVNSADDSILNRKSFLSMIDGRIGLNRFTDILKRPLAKRAPSKGTTTDAGHAASFFISAAFEAFYQRQVDAIRAGIFEFYTGSAGAAPGDAMQQQLIEMQKDRIAELETLVAELGGGTSGAALPQQSSTSAKAVAPAAQGPSDSSEVTALQATLQVRDTELAIAREAVHTLQVTSDTERVQAQLELAAAQSDLHRAQSDSEAMRLELVDLQGRFGAAESERAGLAAQLADCKAALAAAGEEILTFKQRCVQEHEDRKHLQEQLEQRDRQIAMLTGEIRNTQSTDTHASGKIADLEARNAQLKQQLWEAEAEIENARRTAESSTVGPQSPARLAEVPLDSPTAGATRSEVVDLARVVTAVLTLVKSMGIEDVILEYDSVAASLQSRETSAAERSQLLEDVVEQCRNAVNDCVGECSDIAEGAGLRDLQGEEGSLLRIRDCCRQLREQIVDVGEDEIEQLRLQLQIQAEQLTDEERIRTELSDEIVVLQTELDEARQQLEQASQDQTKRSAETEEIERLRSSLQEAQQQLEQSQQEANALNASLAVERAKTQELTEAAELRYLAVEQALNDARAETTKANQEVAHLQVQLETAHHSVTLTASEIRAELEEARGAEADAKAEMARLTAQLEEERVAAQVREEETCRDVTAVLTEELQEVRSAEAEARAQVAALTVLLEEERSAAQAREEATRRDVTAVLAHELRELRAQLADREHAALSAVANFEHATAGFAAEKQQLLAQLAQCAASAEEREGQLQEVARLQEAHAAAAAEWEEARQRFEQRVAEAEAQIASLSQRDVQLDSELGAVRSAAEKTIHHLQNELDGHKLLSGHFMEAAAGLRAALDTAERTAAEKEAQLHAAQAEVIELAGEKDIFAREAAATDEVVQSLQDEVLALRGALRTEREELKLALHEQQERAGTLVREMTELRATNETEFAAQDERVGVLMIQHENTTAQIRDLARQLKESHAALDAHKSAESALRAELDGMIERLHAEQALVAQLRATYEASASSTDALQSQEAELRRLTVAVDTLHRDLQTKEQQLQTATSQLRRREGENAGVLATFESVKADLEVLRAENDRLTEQLVALNKAVKDKEREVRSLQAQQDIHQAELERLRSAKTITRVPSPRAITSPDRAARKATINA
jgi:chromosome segregation ATPase